ncbi:MAG: Do family serine endopeptidase [Orrella sp.]|jgi:serine protease Do
MPNRYAVSSHSLARTQQQPQQCLWRVMLLSIAFVALSFLGMQQALANTAGLPDFTGIVEKADEAVVNIRTTATVDGRGRSGQDPYEMFRWFFGPDFQPPGGAPEQRRGEPAPEPEQRSVPRGVGSGFFITADGSILTNHHVIDGADEIFVTLTDGREFKAVVVGSDARTDVALLKIDATDMVTLPIGSAQNLKKGQWVLAIGSPFGLQATVTAGIVSAIGRETGDYLPFIQTDVAVNPGNSGGPLLDMSGQVVGINAQIVSRSGGFMGISLAIPIDEAMSVADQLKTNGKVVRGRIGVQIGEVNKDVAEASGLSDQSGAMVSRVEPDGPADAAGLKAGDIILSFGGKKIAKWSDLPRVVGATKPGQRVEMAVWRRGKPVTLMVKVGEMPSAEQPQAAAPATPEPVAGLTALGLTVVDLTDKERADLNIEKGVKVTESADAGASAGIAVGDIVLTVGNNEVGTAKQFVELVKKAGEGKPVGMMVQRNGQAQWVLVRPKR